MSRVLLVDDEPQMLIAMREALRSEGLAIETASSAREALSVLRGAEFDLIVTDMRMPEMTGLELLRECAMAIPRAKLVMVTAYGTVEQAVEAMKLGAFDYLLKPFSASQLKAVVTRALESSRPVASARQRTSKAVSIVTQDAQMLRLLDLARHAATGRTTILLQAESGTGKELVARFIHQQSPRADRPFVAVNCAAVPETLLESELFGHEKGAFTGAAAQKLGKFELADGGTILLDEISEMAPVLQAKLLRVLQEREIDRVGGRQPIRIDVRVIATTNRDLAAQVRSGHFREDLYYRLNVIPLTLPPLRERPGDISLLARHFCRRYAMEIRRQPVELSDEALSVVQRHSWPGNVRELENVIQRAVALCGTSVIEAPDLMMTAGARLGTRGSDASTVEEMERQLILQTLSEAGGNRTHAARKLGISIRTLRNKLRGYRELGALIAQPGEKILPRAKTVSAI